MEGVVSGVSDLILLKSNGNYNSLCIEMKVGKNKQTENQIEWQKIAEANNNKYIVVKTIDEFQQEVTNYLNYGQN